MSRARVTSWALLALAMTGSAGSAAAQPKPPAEAKPPPTLPDAVDPAAPAPAAPAKAPTAKAPPPDDPGAPVRTVEIAPRGRAVAEAEPVAPLAPFPTITVAEPAEGSPAAETPVVEPPAAKGPPHKQYFSAGAGVRAAVVSSEGYDPYSKNNALPMVSLFGTFTPWPTRPVSGHLAFEWDFGSSGAQARGLPSSLSVHRLALGLEGRYAPVSRISLFARAMPSAIHVDGSVRDSFLNQTLATASWIWGLDLTGGAAARIAAVGSSDHPLVSFWVALDMGYRLTGSTEMKLRPGELSQKDAVRSFGDVPLPSLDLSGFVGRLSASVAF